MSELLEGVEGLPEEEYVFASSGASFVVESDDGGSALRMTGILILFIAGLGFANGLDYSTPESGLIRPDEFIYSFAQAAPDGSAVFSGMVLDQGQPVAEAEVYVSMQNAEGDWVGIWQITDNKGEFRFEDANPGLIRISVLRMDVNNTDIFENRAILSPPSFFEPIGYTSLQLEFPEPEIYEALSCEDKSKTCIRKVEHPPEQMAHPLIDPSAGITYVMIGLGFMGLSLIAAGFAIIGIKNSSRALLRTASVFAFFTQGHLYSACIFGILAFVLTFTIPRKSITLDA
jgi:hypothetical protein